VQKLIEGLHKFRSEVFDSEQPLFARLSKGQHPEALFRSEEHTSELQSR